MTVSEHVAAVRKDPSGAMATLIASLKADASLLQQARAELQLCHDLEKAGRLGACWIQQITKTTLTDALAAANL